METKIFNVISKGRKYYQAKIKGYDCKIEIEGCEELEIGKEVELVVEDISVRSKYGTDLKFKCVTTSKDRIVLATEYNLLFITDAKKIGGVWDKEDKVWVFPAFVKNEVDELDYIYNSKKITIEITAIKDIHRTHDLIEFCGIPLAKASGRDSGAFVYKDISVLKGGFVSGGSVKNWATILGQDSVIRLEIPQEVLKRYRHGEKEYFDIKEL